MARITEIRKAVRIRNTKEIMGTTVLIGISQIDNVTSNFLQLMIKATFYHTNTNGSRRLFQSKSHADETTTNSYCKIKRNFPGVDKYT